MMSGAELPGRRLQAGIVGILLLLYVFLAVSAATGESNVFDEALHLTAGYLHWTHHEEKLWPENGVLAQGWASLPLLLDHLKVTRAGEALPRNMEQWEQGYRFFYRMGNDPAAMLFQARLMVSLLGAALGALVFLWSRELFGATAGLLSLFMFVFCPTMLANGALVTSDMASSLGFLAATYCFWRLTHAVSAQNLVLSVLSLGLLALSKMSSILIIPIFLLILAVRLFSTRSIGAPVLCGGPIVGRWPKAGTLGLLFLVHALAVIGFLWLAYDFKYVDWGEEAIRRKALDAPGFLLWSGHGLKLCGLEALDRSGLLPRAYVEGLSYTLDAINRGGFALGSFSETGRWWFFPLSFLVKTPVSTLVLIALSLAAYAKWRRVSRLSAPAAGVSGAAPGPYELAPLLILGGVFLAACLSSNINVGHRHMMPVYPVLFVLAGANALWLRFPGRAIRAGLGILLAGLVAESFSIRPHYLAFFNVLVGGPSHGYRFFVDSSLDWGQDLPGLRRWLDRDVQAGRGAKVYLSYFGTAEPDYYGIKSLRLPDRFGLLPSRPFPLAGGIYCISATSLQAAYWTRAMEEQFWLARQELSRYAATLNDPEARKELLRQRDRAYWNSQLETFEQLRFLRLCVQLQKRDPDDSVGYSILIYRLTDDAVKKALDVSPSPQASAPAPAKAGSA
jgi:hypothetical protein